MSDSVKKYSEFGKRLDSIRNQGEKKKAFALRIGVHPNMLSVYLRSRTPAQAVLQKISDKTGVSVDWLLTGEGEKHRQIGIIPNAPRVAHLDNPLINNESQISEPIMELPGPAGIVGAKNIRNLGDHDWIQIINDLLTNLSWTKEEREILIFALAAAATSPERKKAIIKALLLEDIAAKLNL